MLKNKFIKNLNCILGVNKVTKVAVAVSGGADSIALLHLLICWARIYNISITVFSVDHNLRNQSKLEIAYVEELSKKFGVDFVALSWKHSNDSTAIQEKARIARYNLITDYCKKLGVFLLLTAHHLDDMLETYQMKKSKKTGILALKPNITYFWNNIWVVRPLYNIEKKELIDYLVNNNILWFEDESNNSDKYERNRIRKTFSNISFEEKNIILEEYNAATNEANKLTNNLIKAVAEVISIYKEGYAKINIEKFSGLCEEIKIHLMNYTLTMISGKTTFPRYRSLEHILSSIANNTFKKCTLNHCNLINKDNNIIIFKEKNSVTEVETALISNIIWDNKFKIILNKESPLNDCLITRLKINDYIKLKKVLDLKKLAQDSNNNHKEILFTLPVIKTLEKVVAIPHISYYDNDILDSDGIKVIFKPNLISRFTQFF